MHMHETQMTGCMKCIVKAICWQIQYILSTNILLKLHCAFQYGYSEREELYALIEAYYT